MFYPVGKKKIQDKDSITKMIIQNGKKKMKKKNIIIFDFNDPWYT